MRFNSGKYKRRSIRLKGYDYSRPGYYYVTICSQNRECLFGEINNSKIVLNECGKMIDKIWREIPIHYFGTIIDEYILMPNHLHGIVGLGVGVGPCAHPQDKKINCMKVVETNNKNHFFEGQAQGPAPTTKTLFLSNVIERFKSLTTKKYIEAVKFRSWEPFNKRLWQRNYYDHIIRNDEELNEIRKYIKNNPLNWSEDDDNPINIK